jgi:hypothetical protein
VQNVSVADGLRLCRWEPQPNGTPGLMALHLRAMDAIHAVAPGTVYLIEVELMMPSTHDLTEACTAGQEVCWVGNPVSVMARRVLQWLLPSSVTCACTAGLRLLWAVRLVQACSL